MADKRRWKIEASEAQNGFLLSSARYPAFVGGWGCGKTLFAILKMLRFAAAHPGGLGLIARREYTDLRDSTINDFRRYTGLAVLEQRKEVVLPETGGFKVMFRHASEFNVLQNVTLSAVFLEQADEIEDEGIFDFLRGRLRGGQEQQFWLTANATDTAHWIYRRWKEDLKSDYALFEMGTMENAGVLPESFTKDLGRMEKDNPAMYRRYVLNEWGVSDNQFVLIPAEVIDGLAGTKFVGGGRRSVVSIDPSGGGDECPLMAFVNEEVKELVSLHEKDTMKIVGQALLLGRRHHTRNFAVDTIGLGQGVADRLSELGQTVIRIGSAEKSTNERYANRRAEMYGLVSEMARDRKVPGIDDVETRRQLASVRYKVMGSNGAVALENKDEVRKRIGRSPDRADCYVYGIWASRLVPDETRDFGYERKRGLFRIGSHMAA